METICRFCRKKVTDTFIDLGVSPLSNSYVAMEKENMGEIFFPLKAKICRECLLVQLDEYESPGGIFSDYAYLSSFSESWLRHAENYVNMMIDGYGLNQNSQIIELASNDGYLLQYFKKRNIPALGIEPAKNVAEIANKKGIETIAEFFGEKLASELKESGRSADLVVANNVLAHVPDLNDFVSGIKKLLKGDGIATLEFPYLLNLIDYNQFDTIYHEHFSYFSFYTVRRIFEKHHMRVFKVDRIPTHGGSLRIYVCHGDDPRKSDMSVDEMIRYEQERGAEKQDFYLHFMQNVENIKSDTLSFLISEKRKGKKICAYGAPAKGNTLLNYCGIGSEYISFTVDKNPLKQNTRLPGSRIPVYEPKEIYKFKPDFLVILPWNIKDEIIRQEAGIREWNGKFVTFIPKLEVQ